MEIKKMALCLCALALAWSVNGAVRELTIGESDVRSGRWLKELSATDTVHLTLDASVVEIPARAFMDCRQLHTLQCGKASRLHSVGDFAFFGCDHLTTLTLPASVTSIGEGCFQDCVSLRALTIPAGVTTIPARALARCEQLTEIRLPSGLKSIKRGAFQYCRSLREVVIPAKVVAIGSNAFAGCESLTEIVFPASVRELGSYVMSDCSSLVRATLPANSALLGELMFSGCVSLRELTEPSARVPLFDCGSFIFEPDEHALYDQCVLRVPSLQIDRYARAPGWCLFLNIRAKSEE